MKYIEKRINHKHVIIMLCFIFIVFCLIKMTYYVNNTILYKAPDGYTLEITSVTINYGDTLTSIANAHMKKYNIKNCSTESMIRTIKKMNNLETYFIKAGNNLILPYPVPVKKK